MAGLQLVGQNEDGDLEWLGTGAEKLQARVYIEEFENQGNPIMVKSPF